MKRQMTCALILLLTVISCTSGKEKQAKVKEVQVFNVSDATARSEIVAMDLDKTHPNLLNPSIGKESFESYYKSWSEYHHSLNIFLKEHNFDWGIPDESIKLFNKIYFNKEGEVKYYVYRIYGNVSLKKANEYGVVVQDFFKKERIDVTRSSDFAQCGKAQLVNFKSTAL